MLSSKQQNSEKIADIPPIDVDDNLINELEKMEGLKKDDATTNNTAGIAEELQKTSDLLKDLEDDPSVNNDGGNPQKSSSADSAAKSKVEDVAAKNNGNSNAPPTAAKIDEVDRAQVDSTTEVSLKRKHSEENLSASGISVKKQNITATSELPTTSAVKSKQPEPATATTTKKSSEQAVALKSDTDTAISSTSNDLSKKTETVVEKKVEQSPSKSVVTPEKLLKPEQTKIVNEVSPAKSKSIVDEAVSSSQDKNATNTIAGGKTLPEADSSDAKKSADKEIPKQQLSSSPTTKIESTVSSDTNTKKDAAAEKVNAVVAVENSKNDDSIEKMDVDDNEVVTNDKKNTDAAKCLNVENKALANMMNNGGTSTPNSNNSSVAAASSINITPIQKHLEMSTDDAITTGGSDEKTVSDDTTTITESSQHSDVIKASGTTTGNIFYIFLPSSENLKFHFLFQVVNPII